MLPDSNAALRTELKEKTPRKCHQPGSHQAKGSQAPSAKREARGGGFRRKAGTHPEPTRSLG